MAESNEDLKWSNYDFTKIPYDDIVQVGQRTLLYRDLFTVSWLLGRFCNYRCSYCWPYARSDRKDHRPTELCLKTIDRITEEKFLKNFYRHLDKCLFCLQREILLQNQKKKY